MLVTPRGPSGLNFVPLLSNGSTAFTHGGVWYQTGTDYTLDQVRLFGGDFNGDGLSDLGLVTPRGASGLNFVPLLSNGSTAFTHGGVWYQTGTDYTLDQVRLFGGDFNGDGLSDLGLVTPRGASGLNFVPLLSNGSTAFTHGGVWYQTGTDYTLDQVRLFGGDFNGDGLSDLGLVTPRGASGLNFVPLLSNGSTAFTHGGVWYQTGTDYTLDQVRLFGGDFNGDGLSDLGLVTPRGASGLNFVPLLSNGSTAFTHGGVWYQTGTDYTLDQVRLFGGDFNGDGLSDLGLVTPRGASGLNFVPLLSNGSTAFTHGGVWYQTGTDYTLDRVGLGGSFADVPSLPYRPTNASAVAGNGSATVTWAAPIFSGRGPIASYEIKSSPGGHTSTVGGGTTSAVVSGLSNEVAYTFNVIATNAVGSSRPSDPSNSVTPTAKVAKVPTAVVVTTGSAGGGSAASLAVDDGSFLQVKSTKTATRKSAWYGKFKTVPSALSSVRVTYSGLNSLTCSQVVAIYQWTTKKWVALDTRPVGTTEALIADLAPPGAASTYVKKAGGELRVRVTCSTKTGAFVASADLLKIVYIPA